jgi:ubiquinone/menaquinone biosynthesis C-methylase UbiE/DNA-binding HxlR family transcriptional regulator
MIGKKLAKLGKIVETLKAAGEETRLRLLALLSRGELSVKDLTDILGQSQPRVSRHLKLLADAGLVVRHAEGSWAYYRMADGDASVEIFRALVKLIDPDDEIFSADICALEQVRQARRAQADTYFSQIAEKWDRLRNLHVPDVAVEAGIVEALGDKKVGHLIDLGTGTGRMLELLASHYQSATGIDSNREMIAIARAKLAGAAISHAHVQLGDIGSLEQGVALADLIVLHQVLHYFDDPGQVLAQAADFLTPGGRILIVDFAPHDLEFLRTEQAHRRLGLPEDQMAGWAEAAGMQIVQYRKFSQAGSIHALTVCLWVLEQKRG